MGGLVFLAYILSIARAKAPATGLTQSRKREAKGIPTGTQIAPMVSHENPLVAPKLVRLSAHDPVSQPRRADAQRRQAAAQKAWNPTEKPDWLDEKTYCEKIQPLLINFTVAAIAAALGISKPYATDIRAGCRMPHPRHWLKLARLVEIMRDK
jgi:hypothetical protein